MDKWWVYIVEKKTGLYVGLTTDLENRMRQHGQRIPLYYEGPISKSDALKRERTLKGWSRKKKLELITKASSQGETASLDRSEGVLPVIKAFPKK
jgi:predicted GIY-YIG superfamily endonuclease